MGSDDAWTILNDLGKIEKVQFMDLNQKKMPHEMKFAKTIKNIDEIQKKIE